MAGTTEARNQLQSLRKRGLAGWRLKAGWWPWKSFVTRLERAHQSRESAPDQIELTIPEREHTRDSTPDQRDQTILERAYQTREGTPELQYGQ